MRILYIGKFQPFHLGHLQAVNIMKELSDDLVMAVGSPKDSGYFTLDERLRMVKENTEITPQVVEDLMEEHPLYNNWGRYVLNTVGNVDIVATGNPYVQRDFQEEGKHILLFSRNEGTLSGTIIRNLIESQDESWKYLVPENSKKIIKSSEYYRRFNNERR
jgi:nicotinamide-nucleotide adenylyltransferase